MFSCCEYYIMFLVNVVGIEYFIQYYDVMPAYIVLYKIHSYIIMIYEFVLSSDIVTYSADALKYTNLLYIYIFSLNITRHRSFCCA